MRLIDADELYRAKFHGVAEIVPPDEYNPKSYKRGWNDAIDAITDKSCTPTVELDADRWVPVKEKLPLECEEVIITWVNLDPPSYLKDIKGKPFTGAGIYCRGRWFWYSVTCKDYCEEYGFSQVDEMDEEIKVLAWMPLPECYRGEDYDTD